MSRRASPFVSVSLLILALACNAPLPQFGTGHLPEGYVRIPAGTKMTIEDPAGATLSIPAESYHHDVAIRFQAVENAALPGSTATVDIVSPIFDIDLNEAVDQKGPLTLRIPYQPESLPESASPHALTIVWWDGASWREVPSDVDPEMQVVRGQLDHFSLFALAWSRFREIAYEANGSLRDAFYDSSYTHDAFTIHYTTHPPQVQQSYWSGRLTVEDDRPPGEDADQNGVPDYIEALGEYLAQARATYDGGGAFEGVTIPVSSTIHVFVLDVGFDPTQESGTMGDANPITSHIQIDNKLSDAQLRNTAAHELFHYWQFSQLWSQSADKHRWWLEATSAWAMDEVNDQLNLYTHDVRVNIPNPPWDGFGHIHERSISEFYASASLVKYLENSFPGFTIATFTSAQGLSYGRAWYESFASILSDRYGAELSDVMDDFFASYYYHRDFDADIPDWFAGQGPRRIADPLIVANPGAYHRYTTSLAPYSGQLISVLGGNDLERASLIVRQHHSGDDAFVYAFGDRGTTSDREPVNLPGSLGRLGTVVSVGEPELEVQSFGPAGSAAAVNQVHLVTTNTTGPTSADLELEIYALEPPKDLQIEELDTDQLVLTWTEPSLPIGERESDAGARAGYHLYKQSSDGTMSLVMQLDANSRRAEISPEDLRPIGGQEVAILILRTVDKYGNESPNSTTVATAAESLSIVSVIAEEFNCEGVAWGDYITTYCDYEYEIVVSYSVSSPAVIECGVTGINERWTVDAPPPNGQVNIRPSFELATQAHRSVSCGLKVDGRVVAGDNKTDF